MEKKISFLRFREIAILYLLTFQAMVIFGFAFVPYMRYKVIKIGNLILKITALYFLTNMLTSKTFYYNNSKNSRTLLTVTPCKER